MRKEPFVFAISGIKNSGKTTMVTNVLPYLIQKGYLVATIKHDGHDFEADVEGTDSYRHAQAGAYGTAIFSGEKFMVVKQQKQVSEKELMKIFPEADMILIEGMKGSHYPKLEVVRKANQSFSVCEGESLLAIATDLEIEKKDQHVAIFDLMAYSEIANFIEGRYLEWEEKQRKE